MGVSGKKTKIKLAFTVLGIAAVFILFFLPGVEVPSLFNVSVAPAQGILKLAANRGVILDDPSGWVNGWNTTACDGPCLPVGNQFLGEETTIRWFVLAINSSGRAVQVNVTTQLFLPDGSLFFQGSQVTDINGFAGFSRDLDNLNQRPFLANSTEGNWEIRASAVIDGQTVNASETIIYDEFGCGKSGIACHVSQDWQPNRDANIKHNPQNMTLFPQSPSRNSPYVQNRDTIHGISGHGAQNPQPQILAGECMTCHKSYDGTYINASVRQFSGHQFPGGPHADNVECTGCHGIFDTGNNVLNMPVKRCYDCHPILNNNLTSLTYIQSGTQGYSFLPLDTTNTVRAHDSGSTVPCILCHASSHNITKPFNSPETTNSFTEFQHCQACHTAFMRHNDSVSCTVCHSQDAHVIKVFSQDASYINGSTSPFRGNCTGCHQNASFFGTLLAQPKAGSFLKNPAQVRKPMNHSDDISAGRKWLPHWTNGTDGAAQLSSCKYCHGETMHRTSALGRPSLWKGDNTVNSTVGATSWCASCHWEGYASGINTYNDMVNTFREDGLLIPPEITGNATFGANQSNPVYFNHSNVDKNDITCLGCHGTLTASITEFIHDVRIGTSGGADCAACHDTGGFAPKTINFSAFKEGVHKNLNSNATNITQLTDTTSKACWACHGEGTEPEKHPQRYKNPRRCSSNDCHSLDQSFKASAVYSHFKDADLNANPFDALSYNISTNASCEVCHSNSLIISDENLNASVSHYASRKDLIDSKNCIYCHLDRDNSIKWGNATEINKNRTALVEMDRLNNKFTARAGDFVDLGMGYRIKASEVSVKRGSAAIVLYKVDTAVDNALVNTGNYTYEETRTVNNASFKTPVIVLNITGMFLKDNESFIQFEGFRIKRLHYENKTTLCYLCHFSGDLQKHKYTVIDRRDKYVYYTEVLFNSSDINEYDQDKALQVLANKTAKEAFVDLERAKRKTLQEGEKWSLSENYMLTLGDVAIKSDSAQFTLEAGGRSYSDVAKRGEELDFELSINYLGYSYTNITIFRAKVSEILQGNPNIVVLEDVLALSPEIRKIRDNDTISGYNTSWLWENNTFLTGRIPASMHSPLLYDGKDGGADCISCHRAELGFRIELGAHEGVNKDAPSNVASSDKACWACHGDGNEPRWHPATYKTPMKCKACHVEQARFKAPYIGDEGHGALDACGCHTPDIHNIIRYNVSPEIRELSLSKKEVYAGEEVTVNATAAAGYQMRLRGAEYYLDSQANPMYPVDGSFDENVEELTAKISTTGLKPGTHLVSVRAMERNNKWGEAGQISLIVKEKESEVVERSREMLLMVAGIVLVLIVLVLYIWKRVRQRR